MGKRGAAPTALWRGRASSQRGKTGLPDHSPSEEKGYGRGNHPRKRKKDVSSMSLEGGVLGVHRAEKSNAKPP